MDNRFIMEFNKYIYEGHVWSISQDYNSDIITAELKLVKAIALPEDDFTLLIDKTMDKLSKTETKSI